MADVREISTCSYNDLEKNYKVVYVAGGAAQNAARAAQVRRHSLGLASN